MRHQLFGISWPNNVPTGIGIDAEGALGKAFTVVFGWPEIAAVALGTDINLEFTIGLRQVGSVTESLRGSYGFVQGLRALNVAAKQPSVRAVLGF
jgi:hypothetical protein